MLHAGWGLGTRDSGARGIGLCAPRTAHRRGTVQSIHAQDRGRHRRVEQPHKFGNKALRAFERQGYTVIPINPHERRSRDTAYRSVLDVPGPIDMATVYVPPLGRP